MEERGYDYFEVDKTKIDAVYKCFDAFNENSTTNEHYSKSLCKIKHEYGEFCGLNNSKIRKCRHTNEYLVEDDTYLIDNVIELTQKILLSAGIETNPTATIELHQMKSDNDNYVDSKFTIHCDQEVETYIVSVLFYLSRNFEDGELLIHNTENEIIEEIDVRSSSDEKSKIVVMKDDVYHSVNSIKGIGERNLLAVFISLKNPNLDEVW